MVSRCIMFVLVLSLLAALCAAAAAQENSTKGTTTPAAAGSSAVRCEGTLAQCLRDIDAEKIVDCPLLPYVTGELRTPPSATTGYTLQALRPGLWTYWDGVYSSLIIHGSRRIAIVDVPNSAGSRKMTGSGTRVTDAVQEVLSDNPSPPEEIHFWLSHPHADHIGAVPRAYKFLANLYPNAKLRVFAPQVAFRALAAFRTIDLPKVTDAVVENRTYSYGMDLEFMVIFLNGHTDADLALYFPPSNKYRGLVYTVDLVVPGVAPFFYFSYARDVSDYITSHEKLLTLDFDQFIGGHLYRIGTKRDVESSLKYAQDVILASVEAVKSISTEDIAKGVPGAAVPGSVEFGNTWYVTGLYLKALESRCYRIVIEKYGCRLAAVDVTLRSACTYATTYVRLSL